MDGWMKFVPFSLQNGFTTNSLYGFGKSISDTRGILTII